MVLGIIFPIHIFSTDTANGSVSYTGEFEGKIELTNFEIKANAKDFEVLNEVNFTEYMKESNVSYTGSVEIDESSNFDGTMKIEMKEKSISYMTMEGNYYLMESLL